MNHTSEDHEWAKRARAGEKEYQDRYFFFDNYDIPSLYEQTCLVDYLYDGELRKIHELLLALRASR